MADLTLIDLEGVYLTSAGLFAKDCAFPITHMEKNCPPDAFIRNLPVFIGEWADDTTVPVLTDRTYNIDTTGIVDAECDTAIVTVDLDGCEYIAPNQITLDLATANLPWQKLIEKVCRMRGVSPKQLGIIFDGNGQLITENPYVPNLVRIAMTILGQALMGEIAYSAGTGDSANARQFDGFFTQLRDGWGLPQANPCAASINTAQVIDWSTLTGVAPLASPDDVTIAAQTVTLWGTVYDVPEGLNLAQFLEDLYIPAVEQLWASNAGGVTMWEMFVRTGSERCILNTAACMQPCGLDSAAVNDPELRARYAAFRNSLIGQFFPSGTIFSVKPTAYVEPSSIYFGAREIGGNPTYGLIWRDIESVLDAIAPMNDLYGLQSGLGDLNAEPLLWQKYNLIDQVAPFEDNVIHWDMTKVSPKCVKATVMTELGLLANARHLWLKIDNITCASFVAACDPDIEVDGEPLPLPIDPVPPPP